MNRRTGWLGWSALLLLAFCAASLLRADPALPPKPDRYVDDQVGILDAGTASSLNDQLEQFERDTSNQFVVAILPSLPADAELAQYCTDVGRAWGVGQKGPSQGQKGGNNGAIFFVFYNDHKVFIATGYGLEGSLPDATCENILDSAVRPAFRRGDYAGGIQAGVSDMIAATKGEYKGTGVTHAEEQDQGASSPNISWIIFAIFLFIIISRVFFSRFGSAPFIFTGGGFGGGGFGGFGGGGFGGSGGGGGGGFSGGGGSFGGGGAGGSW